MTNVPAMNTYTSVVIYETVHIALILAALNVLDMMAMDIMNAYITAPCKKKSEPCLVLNFEKTKATKSLQ